MPSEVTRCGWVTEDPLYIAYHDEEWGVPEHDDDRLFEKLLLDGAQAGLSWITILRKRENYRRAFEGFDAERLARYGEREVARLLNDPGIVRNKLKIASAISNAQAYLRLRDSGESFDQYLWSFVGGKTKQNRVRSMKDIPVTSPEAEAMSKDLKKRGFTFVGPTILYAFMQAVGMVNDHVIDCFRHEACARTPHP